MFAPQENEHEEVSSLESALQSLRPAAPRVNRDRLMFLAGQASSAPQRSKWGARASWAFTMAASVVIAAVIGRATAPADVQFIERVVQIPVQVQPDFAEDLQPKERALIALDAVHSDSSRVRWLRDIPVDRATPGPYVRLRDQVVALGPDMLPALGQSGELSSASSDSYVEMRQRLVQ
jgi:hypothetical protein